MGDITNMPTRKIDRQVLRRGLLDQQQIDTVVNSQHYVQVPVSLHIHQCCRTNIGPIDQQQRHRGVTSGQQPGGTQSSGRSRPGDHPVEVSISLDVAGRQHRSDLGTRSGVRIQLQGDASSHCFETIDPLDDARGTHSDHIEVTVCVQIGGAKAAGVVQRQQHRSPRREFDSIDGNCTTRRKYAQAIVAHQQQVSATVPIEVGAIDRVNRCEESADDIDLETATDEIDAMQGVIGGEPHEALPAIGTIGIDGNETTARLIGNGGATPGRQTAGIALQQCRLCGRNIDITISVEVDHLDPCAAVHGQHLTADKVTCPIAIKDLQAAPRSGDQKIVVTISVEISDDDSTRRGGVKETQTEGSCVIGEAEDPIGSDRDQVEIPIIIDIGSSHGHQC